MDVMYYLGVALFVIAGVILVGAVVAYVVSTLREGKREKERELNARTDTQPED